MTATTADMKLVMWLNDLKFRSSPYKFDHDRVEQVAKFVQDHPVAPKPIKGEDRRFYRNLSKRVHSFLVDLKYAADMNKDSVEIWIKTMAHVVTLLGDRVRNHLTEYCISYDVGEFELHPYVVLFFIMEPVYVAGGCFTMLSRVIGDYSFLHPDNVTDIFRVVGELFPEFAQTIVHRLLYPKTTPHNGNVLGIFDYFLHVACQHRGEGTGTHTDLLSALLNNRYVSYDLTTVHRYGGCSIYPEKQGHALFNIVKSYVKGPLVIELAVIVLDRTNNHTINTPCIYSRGVDVDKPGVIGGVTPLMVAMSSVPMYTLLLERGADPWLKDDDGRTVMHRLIGLDAKFGTNHFEEFFDVYMSM